MPSDPAPIAVSGSDVGVMELAAVQRIFELGYLGMGSEVAAFEEDLTAFMGRPAVCVATGTAALQLALQACGIGAGDEVIVPSFTYVATWQAISATGARPVAAEIDPVSLTIDPSDVPRRLSPRTKAIVPVHFASGLADMESLSAIAHDRGLRIIEDAAHAFGTLTPAGVVGSFGDVSCFSFDPIKNITSGEGGCITTSDEQVLDRVRDARLLGVQGDSKARVKQTRLYQFEVEAQGWRYHMSNVNAAIGRVQLGRLPQFAARRRQLASFYEDSLRESPLIDLIPLDYRNVLPHIFVARFPDQLTRDRVRAGLLADFKVGSAIHYQPNHLLQFYRQDAEVLPVTEREASRVLSLPLHTRMSDQDADRVLDAVHHLLCA